MEEFFCDYLNSTLTFFPDKIMPCCTQYKSPVYISNFNVTQQISFEKIEESKKKYFINLNNQEKEFCKDCIFIRPKSQTDTISKKYKELNINHWLHCNCNCIYCCREDKDDNTLTGLFKRKSKFYDMLPIVKELYARDLLDKENLIVRFQGGDVSVLKEFPDLVREFYENGVYKFHFLTNNIIYQPIIKDMLKEKKGCVVISVDAGCRETYKKIKRVDKFNQVVSNLKRYIKEGGNDIELNVKYIVIPTINDNLEEATKFLNLMKEIKIPIITFDIDSRYYLQKKEGKKELPEHIYNIYYLFKEFAKKNNVILDIFPVAKKILEEGYF